ncbi:MAG: glycosyltransferase N-terminal domain-containing protein [Deferrisomatales bacterium]|nr:glycosyltransferase N-terminal domain-containing protein [Deferrisomatales bacterium]
MTLPYLLYQMLGWLALPLAAPVVAVRAARDPRYRVGWGERLGAWGNVPSGAVWVHGASVGEMRAVAPLLALLRDAGEPLMLSTTSPSGRDAAAALAGPGGAARLLPLDLAPLVRRVLQRCRPRALVVVETELWPALLTETARAGVPLLLVNGRISDRALPRYRRVRPWVRPLLGRFAAIHAQSEADAERFRQLGAAADRVVVVGNLKYDLPAPDPSAVPATALRHARADGWRPLVAGSTHPGEEHAVAAAAATLRGNGHRVGLVVAPRHLERVEDAAREVASGGRPPVRWSTLGDPREEGILEAFRDGRAILVDEYGVLGDLYGGADAAFVGGTLVAVGGHNLLEPLNWGVVTLFGPHTENSREVRDAVVERGVGFQIADAAELATVVDRLWSQPDTAATIARGTRRLFAASRGGAARALAELRSLGAVGSGG